MDNLSIPIKFLISYLLGSVIGLERGDEAAEKKVSEFRDLGGVRVFSLISLLGGIAGYLSTNYEPPLYLLLVVFFFVLILVYYRSATELTKSASLTTELAAIFTFLIGYFTTSEALPLQYIIALTVVLSITLTLKERVRDLYLGIKQHEINSFMSFAVIALVILPFLPNQPFYLSDIPGVSSLMSVYNIDLGFVAQLEIINPYRLWLLVALVTGIEVIGYVVNKIVGEKGGTVLSSTLAGFVSATATILSLAKRSKKSSNPNQLLGSAMFSNLTSYLPFFLLAAPLNGQWLASITPTLLILMLSMAVIGYLFIRKFKKTHHGSSEKSSDQDHEEQTIFRLGPAIKFALVLVAVRSITKLALVLLGESGFILASVLASFAGLDAIVINLAEVAGTTITFQMALFTLLLGIGSNLLVKIVLSFSKGSKEFARKLLIASVISLSVSFLSLGLQVLRG